MTDSAAIDAAHKAAQAKEVWYVAHPVNGDPFVNALRAVAWIRFLTKRDPSRVYIAPWVAEVLAFMGHDMGPEFYDRILSDDEMVVSRLDGMLMVGGRVSYGMGRERAAAERHGVRVVDWTRYEVPDQVPDGMVP